ncbi:MAG: caspase domain-containing protein [Thiohalospira sp.]
MKKASTILLFIFLSTINVLSQNIDAHVFEPEEIKPAKTYKTNSDLAIHILIRDRRQSENLYQDQLYRAIGNYLKKSYPKTKVHLISNIRNINTPGPNKVVVIIDLTDFFVAKRHNKWIGRTALNIAIIDFRGNKLKKYTYKVAETSTKPNRKSLQSAKLALNTSFKMALLKSINCVEKSIKGEGSFEIIQQISQIDSDKTKKTRKNLKPVKEKEPVFYSDVDKNIPEISNKFENRYALIIGNEDYSSYQKGLNQESNVEFANRDASIFKLYAEKTLGIPEENIIFLTDAKVVEFSRAINKLNSIIKNLKGEAEIFFYYAGHGFPDEKTKEPYLIPVDVSGTDLEYAISLNEIYNKLTEYPSKKITVFLDACFSGGARNQGLIAARGVKIQPKENILQGNLVVFSASTGTQSSLPFKDQQHGLFSYYLLKKIQETEGKISYAELFDYINQQVSVKSVLINDMEQNPQINISPEVESMWEGWTIR